MTTETEHTFSPYHVYVIRLRPEVLQERPKVARENPRYVAGNPCVYVGSTAHDPQKRYARHTAPESRVGARIVCEYHVCLDEGLTGEQPAFPTRQEAEKHERSLAKQLRMIGYAVWSK